MSTIIFIWPLLSFWTTVLLRQLCKKRVAALPPPTPPSPPPPPSPPLLLLLCCCCCCAAAAAVLGAVVIYGYLFSVFLKKSDAATVLGDANRSFLFSIRDLYFFCDLLEFRRFAHRKHSQSDAGMNLAYISSSMELLV